MKNITKRFFFYLLLLLSHFTINAQNDDNTCPVFALANDLSASNTEFKTLIKNSDNFKAWHLLNKESPALRTNIAELTLVSNNLDKINNVGGYLKWKTLQAGEQITGILGSLIKNGNKIEYTNPAGKSLKWSEQGVKDIDQAIEAAKKLDPLDPNNIGRITEGKVGDFVKAKKPLTGFGQKINPNITDLDVATIDEIIEVKATFNTVKEDQFTKLLDKTADNFCNPNQKKIILYVDKPIKEATDAQVRMIDRIKLQGVTFVNSLEELEKILK